MAVAGADAAKVVTGAFGEEGTLGAKFAAGNNSPRGVAVNQTGAGGVAAGDVYVADFGNNRVQQFSANGTFVRTWGFDVAIAGAEQSSEIQRVTVNATAGNFVLKFGAGGPGVSETAEIPATAGAAAVQSALNAITNVSTGGGSVTVTGGPGNAGGTAPYFVNFDGGPLAGTNVATMTSASGTTPLSGGSGAGANAATIAVVSEGGAGAEICEVATNCKAGTTNNAAGGVSTPVGIDINQTTGRVYVSSNGGIRISEFTATGEFIRAWGLGVVTAGPGNVSPLSAVQTVKVPASVTEGTFTLSFAGRTTGPLAWNAPANAGTGNVQTALRELAPLAAPGTNVNVTGTPRSGASEGVYTITFAGQLKNSPMPPIVPDSTNLVGGSALVEQTTAGVSSFEICSKDVDVCTGGEAGRINGSLGSAANGKLAVDPGTGNVITSDLTNNRMQVFTASGAFVQSIGWRVDASAPADELQVCPKTNVCLGGTAGSALGQVGANATSVHGIGIDSEHNVYVTDFGNKRVQKFDPSGPAAEPTSYVASAFGPSGVEASPFSVAVDPVTDNVLIGRRASGPGTALRIEEYDPAGLLMSTHGEGSTVGSGQSSTDESNGIGAIAVGPHTEPEKWKIYLALIQASVPTKKVYVFDEAPPPACSLLTASEITATSAKLEGIVEPPVPGPEGGYATTYHFEYSKNGILWTSVPVPDAPAGSTNTPVLVNQVVTGLEPKTFYQYRLVASTGVVCTTPPKGFSTLAAPPSISEVIAMPVGASTATLNGKINPNNSGLNYRFIWGPTTDYGNVAPVETEPHLGGAFAFIPVKASISGLKPNTEYHFKLVTEGTEGNGNTSSPDRTFTTSACEGLNAAGLPDCRAFELVSPIDKGPVGQAGTNWLLSYSVENQVAPDGQGIVYPISFGLPDSTAGGAVSYRAQRGEGGWTSLQQTPPALAPPILKGANNSTGVPLYYSTDLSCAIVSSFEPLSGPESENETVEVGGENLFRRDSDGDFELLTESVPTNVAALPGDPYLRYTVVGADPTCDHVIIETSFQYAGVFASGLYELTRVGTDDWTLQNAGVVEGSPDPVPVAAKVGALGGGQQGNPYHAVAEGNPSAGSPRRVYFEALSAKAPNAGKRSLFLRQNGQVGVDVSQAGSPNSGESRFETATADGRYVYFTARTGLATNSPPALADACDLTSGQACSLYRYDAGSDTLVDMAPDTNPADVKGPTVIGVAGASEDGSSVYFIAKGQIVAGKGASYSSNISAGRGNLFVNRGGVVRFVANVPDADLGAPETGIITNVSGGSIAKWASRVSSDGARLLFASRANITGYDSGGVSEAYIYDAVADTLICASCRTDGSPAVGGPSINPLAAARNFTGAPLSPPATLSEDGRRVFFKTRDALAPGAINGYINVYEWSEGHIYLLATTPPGATPVRETRFVGASGSGDDLFIASVKQLSPLDVDQQLDVYDLRVNGTPGVAPQPPAVCNPLVEGSCAGSAAPPPPVNGPPPSSTLVGPGNQVEPPPAAPKKKKKKAKKRSKKGKGGKGKGKKNGARTAKTSGGVGR